MTEAMAYLFAIALLLWLVDWLWEDTRRRKAIEAAAFAEIFAIPSTLPPEEFQAELKKVSEKYTSMASAGYGL